MTEEFNEYSDLRKWSVANTRHHAAQKNTYKTITYTCQTWFCSTLELEIVAQLFLSASMDLPNRTLATEEQSAFQKPNTNIRKHKSH